MFEILEKTRRAAVPRSLSVAGAMLGAFSLGLSAGKLLMGAKPVIDWFTTISQLVMITFYTVVCAFYAFKRDSSAKQ
jgi:hypothetical protein